MKHALLWLLPAAALALTACAAAPAAEPEEVSSAAAQSVPDPTEPPGATPAPTAQPTPVPLETMYARYIEEFSPLEEETETTVTANGCTLTLEDSPQNQPELLVYSQYVYTVLGDSEGMEPLLGEDFGFVGAAEIEAAEYQRGEGGMQTRTVHELHTMTMEEIQAAGNYTRTRLQQYLADYDLQQWTMVAVDQSWTYTAETEAAGPQLPAGRYQRYYLLGVPSGSRQFKIYNVYWEDFYPQS